MYLISHTLARINSLTEKIYLFLGGNQKIVSVKLKLRLTRRGDSVRASQKNALNVDQQSFYVDIPPEYHSLLCVVFCSFYAGHFFLKRLQAR